MEHHQLFVPVFLKNINVKGIYGLHMFPDVDAGKIACRKGPLMAESGELDVMIMVKVPMRVEIS